MKTLLIIPMAALALTSCHTTANQPSPIIAGPVEFDDSLGLKLPFLGLGAAVGIIRPAGIQPPVIVEDGK